MKALVYTEYGSIENLRLEEREKPVPGDHEILVKNYAVSINDWDLGLMQGDFINRSINGMRKPRRQILGSDIAGKVEAVGKYVKRFKPGDEVYGDLSGKYWGGFAEFSLATEKDLELKPAGMSFAEAAAIPQAGMLAMQGLIDKGHLRNGLKILINGAGGGVGTFGVQIAKQFDVEVTGVDHGSKLEMMRALGFDHVMDYTKVDFTKSGQRYDLILDAKTNRPITSYLRVLNPKGVYTTVGGDIGRLLKVFLWGPWISLFTKKRVGLVALKPNKDLGYMNQLFQAGKLKFVIDGPYSLSEFAQAFRKFEKGEHKGKVVFVM